MAISKVVTIVFLVFYVAIIIYIILFFVDPAFQAAIMESRRSIADSTTGANYLWAILISFGICLLGNASIGFPVPFPFVLFTFSKSIYLRYVGLGLAFDQILLNGFFWLEIMGIAVAGGLGSSIGELTSYIFGKGAKVIAEKVEGESKTFENMKGFGRLILEKPKRLYFYVFVAAATPIPDDILFIALGASGQKFNFPKLIFFGWLGKNITTIFYVFLPIFIDLGLTTSGIEVNDTSSVVTEALMLIATLTIMFFILSFNWNKYIEHRQLKKSETKKLNKIEVKKTV